jgi:hypothetical protein
VNDVLKRVIVKEDMEARDIIELEIVPDYMIYEFSCSYRGRKSFTAAACPVQSFDLDERKLHGSCTWSNMWGVG